MSKVYGNLAIPIYIENFTRKSTGFHKKLSIKSTEPAHSSCIEKFLKIYGIPEKIGYKVHGNLHIPSCSEKFLKIYGIPENVNIF